MRVFGYHPVREALRHRPHEVARVWSGRSRKDHRHREVEGLCQRHGVDFKQVSNSELDELTGASAGSSAGAVHNGFVAEMAAAGSGAGGDGTFRVLLEDVQDPRNLGAVLRVCEGAGVGEVAIRDRGSAPVSAAAVKTSAGAADWLSIHRITNTGAEIRRLKDEGFWIYGAAAEGQPAWEIDLKGPVVLCFGGEEKGLRQRTRQLCDGLVSVPMRGRVASLNVATAAAAILYEAVRQRSLAAAKGTATGAAKEASEEAAGVASKSEKG